jgi:hypothetical protein
MSLSEYASKRKNKSSSVVPTLGGGGASSNSHSSNNSTAPAAVNSGTRHPSATTAGDRETSPGSTASGPIGTPTPSIAASSIDDRRRVLSSGSLSGTAPVTDSEMDVDDENHEEAVVDDEEDVEEDDDEGEYVPAEAEIDDGVVGIVNSGGGGGGDGSGQGMITDVANGGTDVVVAAVVGDGGADVKMRDVS